MRLNDALVDDIVLSCLSVYEKLKNNGKPVEGEWTVFSCVVQLECERATVVALGTGSKCVGAGAMLASGAALNDSHAEVCARRAFLHYLYDNIQLAMKNKPSIFQPEDSKFVLKENIEFVFYSSQLPCGDASIFPMNNDDELVGELLQSNKRRAERDICTNECKKVEDIYRTGAKCLPDAVQDPNLPGLEYHRFGQVRTKPGRGDRTLSVSCSDKIARWIHVGIQGALLNLLCEPIFIKHFVFGGSMPYSIKSLNRALLNRNGLKTPIIKNPPEFYRSSLIFTHIKKESHSRPAPGSIIWIKTFKTSEVAVQGKKLGLTKKQAGLPKYSLCITKYKLYQKFLTVLQENKAIRQDISKDCLLKDIPYNEMKRKSIRYLESWQRVKEQFFGNWTRKPDMWDFCVNVT